MKFAIVILAVFCAAAALPLCAFRTVRKTWERGAKDYSARGLRGAVFAKILLRHGGGADGADLIEGCKLFHERFDTSANCVVLSRESHDGRSLAAFALAALPVGVALLHAENGKPIRRHELWRGTQRLLVNVLPAIALLMLLHPGSWRLIPLLGLLLLLLAAIQLLTYPATRAAAAKARAIVFQHELLPPDEIPRFTRHLESLSHLHLAAPLLDCLWLRYLLPRPRRQ